MRPFERYFHRRRHERACRAPSIRHVVDVGPLVLGSRCAKKQELTKVAENALRTPLVHWVDSPRQTHHRARVKLGILDGQLGYRSPRSHNVVPIEHCLIAREEINDTLTTLRARIDQMRPFNGSVELCSNGSDVRVDLTTRSGRIPDELSQLTDLSEALTVNGQVVCGSPNLSLDVNGVALRIGPGVFYQVNLEINALLVQRVLQSIMELNATHVLDLFSGMGNFGIPLAKQGVSVTCGTTWSRH